MATINVENAVIKTASVEIKTLTISGRQVTLSVFRQIHEEDILNDDLSLKGITWGTVNYFWKEDETHKKIHLLWQHGKELRRCILEKKSRRKRYNNTDEYIYRMNNFTKAIDSLEHKIYMAECPRNTSGVNENWKFWNIDNLEYSIKSIQENNNLHWVDKDLRDLEKVTIQLTRALENNQKNNEEMNRLQDALDDKCDKYDQLIENFMELPHLFIAV